jgi:uncharacterized membrane protein YqjE
MTARTEGEEERVRTADILNDILRRVTELMRMEFDLARTEVAENMARARTAIVLLVVAVVLALTALDVLAAAAVAAVAETGIDAGWAALVVGGAVALLAIILAVKGMNDLKLSSIAPDRSRQELRKDAAMFRRGHEEAQHD